MAVGDVTSSAWFIPTAYGTDSFANNANVEASNDTYATATFTGSGDGEVLSFLCYNLQESAANWVLPDGAEFRGIEIQVEAKISSAGEAQFAPTGYVTAAGASDTTNTTMTILEDTAECETLTASDVTYTFGGEGFTFGQKLHDRVAGDGADVYLSGTDIGYEFTFWSIGTSTATISIDHIRVRFLYWAFNDVPKFSGWYTPQNGSAVADGNGTWSNPVNAGGTDNLYATVKLTTATNVSDTLVNYEMETAGGVTATSTQYDYFGMVPLGATIVGVEARVEFGRSDTNGNYFLDTAELCFNSGGSPTPTGNASAHTDYQLTPRTTTDGWISIGGYGNLWGESVISISNMQNINTGTALTWEALVGDATTDLRVDSVQLRFMYSYDPWCPNFCPTLDTFSENASSPETYTTNSAHSFCVFGEDGRSHLATDINNDDLYLYHDLTATFQPSTVANPPHRHQPNGALTTQTRGLDWTGNGNMVVVARFESNLIQAFWSDNFGYTPIADEWLNNSYHSRNTSTSDSHTQPNDCQFVDDGNKLVVSFRNGAAANAEFQMYTLSTPYDIKTLTLDTTNDWNIGNDVRGFWMTNDGTKMYYLNNQNNEIRRATGTAYDLTSFSDDGVAVLDWTTIRVGTAVMLGCDFAARKNLLNDNRLYISSFSGTNGYIHWFDTTDENPCDTVASTQKLVTRIF